VRLEIDSTFPPKLYLLLTLDEHDCEALAAGKRLLTLSYHVHIRTNDGILLNGIILRHIEDPPITEGPPTLRLVK
jgi:hypothetical protein